MNEYIDVFKALSDGTRLRTARLLLEAGRELCICEIMDALALAQYKVSRHVRELKLAGMVEERKEGKFVLYSLKTPGGEFLCSVLGAVKGIPGEMFSSDRKRLAERLSLRKSGKCIVGMKKKGRSLS